MKAITKKVLHIVNVIGFVLVILIYPIGLISEIIGPMRFEQLMEILHIPLEYDRFLYVCWGITAVLILSWLLKGKLK